MQSGDDPCTEQQRKGADQRTGILNRDKSNRPVVLVPLLSWLPVPGSFWSRVAGSPALSRRVPACVSVPSPCLWFCRSFPFSGDVPRTDPFRPLAVVVMFQLSEVRSKARAPTQESVQGTDPRTGIFRYPLTYVGFVVLFTRRGFQCVFNNVGLVYAYMLRMPLSEIDFFVSSTGNLNIIALDHVKPEFASSEQDVDTCFLVHASVWQLDWERLINGVALIEGRSVGLFREAGRHPDVLGAVLMRKWPKLHRQNLGWSQLRHQHVVDGSARGRGPGIKNFNSTMLEIL